MERCEPTEISVWSVVRQGSDKVGNSDDTARYGAGTAISFGISEGSRRSDLRELTKYPQGR